MIERLRMVLLICLLGIGMSGCDSLPDILTDRANKLNNDIKELDERLKEEETKFTKLQGSPHWAFFAPYAQREKWSEKFATARDEITRLRVNYDKQVDPYLDRDESKEAQALGRVLSSIDQSYHNTVHAINFVRDRMQLLENGRKNASSWRAQSRSRMQAINTAIAVTETVRQEAKTNFPDRAQAIDQRFVPLRKLQQGSQQALETVETQFGNHSNNRPADYAAFVDAYMLIERNEYTLREVATNYRGQLASLSKDYSLILRDMKMEYWVKPKQETWCEYEDCFEQSYEFGYIAVSKADYERIENAEQIDDAIVASLGLNPKVNVGPLYNGYTWYVDDSEIRYFHKYSEVQNGKSTERDWEEVDEEDFARHANDFGMAIATKKLGQFEDEVVDQATPPGMDMVGDPRYGNWVSDGKGGQTWSFLEAYAVYSMLAGNSGIFGRSDYDSYRRWRNNEYTGGGAYGWYGASRNTPVYGSRGSYTQSTANHRGSTFGRSGGVSSFPRDIRDAGSATRSRGPGSTGK